LPSERFKAPVAQVGIGFVWGIAGPPVVSYGLRNSFQTSAYLFVALLLLQHIRNRRTKHPVVEKLVQGGKHDRCGIDVELGQRLGRPRRTAEGERYAVECRDLGFLVVVSEEPIEQVATPEQRG